MGWSLSVVDFWSPTAKGGFATTQQKVQIAGVLSAADQQAISSDLTILYNGSPLAASVLDRWANAGHTLHIASSSTPASAATP
jgi:hypothetical protein